MKHLLNDLTEKEKNSIREQHTGGMNVVTENFSKLINAKSGNVKPLVNEREGEDSENFAKWQDSPPHIRLQMLIKIGIYGEKAKQIVMDDKYKDMSWNDIKNMRPRLKKKGESPSDCEHLFKSMDFIYDDYMSQISLTPDEIDEAEAEDTYDQFETELGGILDLANQTECDDETIQDLEIEYNQYLSDMANKLGLREDDMPSYKTKWSEPSDDDM